MVFIPNLALVESSTTLFPLKDLPFTINSVSAILEPSALTSTFSFSPILSPLLPISDKLVEMMTSFLHENNTNPRISTIMEYFFIS